MTDNEIIKALECCCKDAFRYCHECPLEEKAYSQCLGLVRSNALDLINRQKAEIERLKKPKCVNILHARSMGKAYTLYRAIYSEAIKEFAERLKKEMYTVGFDIDNLVKELVGDQNETN
jgi:hypothetical protein